VKCQEHTFEEDSDEREKSGAKPSNTDANPATSEIEIGVLCYKIKTIIFKKYHKAEYFK
jgi:hypothetical protein